MKKNVSSIDGIVRVLAAVIIAIAYVNQWVIGTLAIILLVVGGIFLVTGIVGFCPLYKILGLSSRKNKTNAAG